MGQEAVWRWDETLYAGSARHYPRGRVAYPPQMAEALRDELGLDGSGRLLDVGCGPGAAGLLLARLFAEVVGVDADADMLAEAGREARRLGVRNARWVRLRAEQLPAGLGVFDVTIFAQSFHWMDREQVARTTRSMLRAEGAWVLVNATTHKGIEPALGLPAPPWDAVSDMISKYLGQVRRAGRGSLPGGTAHGEEELLEACGFGHPRRITVPGRALERSVDDVVASVFSLSSAAPHLFGDRLAEFEGELRGLLEGAAEDGRFGEWMREIELLVWRPGPPARPA
ncbi:MAG: class I SAM-dependent methyltransferase [Gaiellales bacterium]